MTEKPKILIVDDKKENLIALRQVLSEVDAEVIETTSGNEALAATLEHDFAVAILDVQMPGMSGYELAKHLRGVKKTQAIPIVFLTAHDMDDQYVFKGYEAGAVDHITKPFSPEILRRKVNAFLEMDRYRCELKAQLAELQRLQDVMLGREDRVQELKREVNELCRRAAEPARYPSQEEPPADPGTSSKKGLK